MGNNFLFGWFFISLIMAIATAIINYEEVSKNRNAHLFIWYLLPIVFAISLILDIMGIILRTLFRNHPMTKLFYKNPNKVYHIKAVIKFIFESKF